MNVKTFDDEGGRAGLVLDRQVFETHGRETSSDGADCYNVFVVADPDNHDVLDCPALVSLPKKILQWQLGEVRVQGCVCLESPQALSYALPLNTSKVPVLCLVWELRDRGWMPRAGLVVHKPDDDCKVFDSRSLASKRAYLQCVLAMETLLAAGVAQVRSDATIAYYDLLLRKPATTVAGRPAKEYEQELKDGGYDVEIPDIEAPAAVHVKRRPAFHGAAALAPDLSDESEAGEAPAVAPALVVPASSSSSGSRSSSPTSSSAVSIAPAAVVAPEALAPDVPDRDEVLPVPEFLFWKARRS